jgi:peptide/nickel transport system ATP-binding protein
VSQIDNGVAIVLDGLTVKVDSSSEGDVVARILQDIQLSVAVGTRLGVVGESGSGKSTLLRAITGSCGRGLLATSSHAQTVGRDMFALSEPQRRELLGSVVALVPQNVGQSLTPHLTIGAHFRDILALSGSASSAVALLDEVGLDGKTMQARYPHELSGGEQQRVLIALALVRDPQVLLLDEPTSALDVGIADEILTLVEEAHDRRRFTLVCVSHDLGVIDRVAQRIVVMHHGKIVEDGDAQQVMSRPAHSYSAQLLASAPNLGVRHRSRGKNTFGETDALISAVDLTVIRSSTSIKRAQVAKRSTTALAAVTLDIYRGEILGVIGESGSGKSTLLKTICGLLTPHSGSLTLAKDIDLLVPTSQRPADVLRRIQMVFQNPDDSLNPAHQVRRILRPEARRTSPVVEDELAALLESVGLEAKFLDRRPAQLSGGETQRVAIARAISCQPDLLLLDEVTSALDVTVQAEVLATLLEIHQRLGTTMLFVSHDIAVVSSIADRIAVLRHGQLVEVGSVDDVIDRPVDQYTKRLVNLARAR